MKKIWLTLFEPYKEKAKYLIELLQKHGFESRGHFWEDDLEKMAWIKARENLLDPDINLWLIVASKEQLSIPSIRYGLSLLAITIQADRGLSFPFLFLLPKEEKSLFETLPTSLKGAEFLFEDDPSWTAKLVARAFTPLKEISIDYRLNVYGNPQIGQWFEVGPRVGVWKGAMFGVSEGEILFHAVGKKGRLPERCVLNYPQKGLKLMLNEREFIAWAVQNEIDEENSYFIKVDGFPSTILFSPYVLENEAEMYVVQLK